MKLPEPFVVAEIGANHNGYFPHAIRLIDAAADAGADAVKFQCYDPDTITIDHDGPGFVIEDGPWMGLTLHQLYTEAQTPREWFPELFLHAERRGIIAFSSVFSVDDLQFLRELDCPIYKISSFEAADLHLLEMVALTGKPVIMSTGLINDRELGHATTALTRASFVAYLHCVSMYPADAAHYNLSRMKFIRQMRCDGWNNKTVGLSDHTLSTILPAVAIGLGATVIEKHLTIKRSHQGPDAAFSLEPDEFKAMVTAVREAWAAIQPSEAPTPYKGLRRSLYAVKAIKQGEVFSPENVRSIRPGGGLSPAKLDDLLGHPAKRPFSYGDPITEDDLE